MKKYLLYVVAFSAIPQMVFAEFDNIQSLITSTKEIINDLIGVVFSLGLLVFFWGMVKYINSAGNAEAAAKGKSIMIYGVIALFVMSSVWGLTKFIGDALGVEERSTISPPGVDIGDDLIEV